MTKVVINRQFGGYSLSDAAVLWLRERGVQEAIEYPIYDGEKWPDGTIHEHSEFLRDSNFIFDEDRSNPNLIAVVEALGEEAFGRASTLKIVEIPDDIDWIIDEYDGLETVEQVHRSWS